MAKSDDAIAFELHDMLRASLSQGSRILLVLNLVVLPYDQFQMLRKPNSCRARQLAFSIRRRSRKASRSQDITHLQPVILTSQPDLPKIDASILSIFGFQAGEDSYDKRKPPLIYAFISCSLSWYSPWLADQTARLPECLITLLTRGDPAGVVDFSVDGTFLRIFMTVNAFLRHEEHLSIDQIIEHLVRASLLDAVSRTTEVFLAQRLLVFAILGWQSMLFLPSFNTCPLQELAIHSDPEQPDSKHVFETLKVSAEHAERPMSVLLQEYGNLLSSGPRGQRGAISAPDTAASFRSPLDPIKFNAHLLFTLMHLKIRWVDTLALHLDYDQSTRTLSLFRYPSFCIAMLRSRGALYSFAITGVLGYDCLANKDDITDILHEVLSSYRLLFGQSKHSRQLFRRLLASTPSLSHNADPLLPLLCTKGHFNHPAVPQDRLIYFTDRDFPVTGDRINLLNLELTVARPKTWKGLIRDRRDTTQYWTFWLVAIIGGLSIILSFTQVVLQAVQIARS